VLRSIRSVVPLLVLLHVVAGLAITFAVDVRNDIYVPFFIAIFFSQAGLLGILLGLGTQPLSIRLAEFAVALVNLCLLASQPAGIEASLVCGLIVICAFVVAIVLSILRRRGLHLRKLATLDRANLKEPLQFGIRHLMVCILATAALLRIGQALDPRGLLGTLFCLGIIFAAVPLAAPWAALGSRRPVIRGLVLVVTAALMGAAGVFYMQEKSIEAYFVIGSSVVVDALILLSSLGLLRRTGLRLVRAEPARAAS
jgi:hypothetical protein